MVIVVVVVIVVTIAVTGDSYNADHDKHAATYDKAMVHLMKMMVMMETTWLIVLAIVGIKNEKLK